MSFLSDLIGGIIGNETADKQADAMVDATKRSNETIMDMFERSNQIQAPNIQAGWNALGMQGSLLGMPNLVPQQAVNQALMATGGGQDVWGMYGQQNPDVMAYYQNNPRALQQFGGDMNKALQYHYETFGKQEGRQLPSAIPNAPSNAFTSNGSPGTVSVGGGAMMQGGDSQPMVQAGGQPGGAGGQIGAGTSVDNAYNVFLDSGFNRAMTDFTNNDLDALKANYATGGKSLSGSAVGAMGDRLARNRYNAFGDYYSALSGISGTGSQLGSQQASQANQVGQRIGANQQNIGNIRASSYGVQGDNNANTANSAINAFANFFGGR
jgi:hypothetical protein